MDLKTGNQQVVTRIPIYYNEDLTHPSNSFNIMFIDLKAGLLGSNYPTGNGVLINYGAVKINYTFNDLQSLATFNIYAWNANTTQVQGLDGQTVFYQDKLEVQVVTLLWINQSNRSIHYKCYQRNCSIKCSIY